MSASLTHLRLLALLLVTLALPCAAAPPVVTNVRASQRAGTELVDVCYDVSASVPPLTVAVQVSADGGATFAVNAVSLTGDGGAGFSRARTGTSSGMRARIGTGSFPRR